MAKLTTAFTIIAVIAGMPAVQAQNAPTTNVSPSPNSINSGNRPTMPSGSEAQQPAQGRSARVTGTNKFCAETSANGPLNCVFASMSDCQKASTGDNLRCVANPQSGTTGTR